MNNATLIELAETWELQAATGGDGLNKLQPPARETLRACADTLRMMVEATGRHAAQTVQGVREPLSEQDIDKCCESINMEYEDEDFGTIVNLVRAIERAHRIGEKGVRHG